MKPRLVKWNPTKVGRFLDSTGHSIEPNLKERIRIRLSNQTWSDRANAGFYRHVDRNYNMAVMRFIVENAKLRTNSVVGSFGSGPGHLEGAVAKMMGRNGRVIASDIDPGVTKYGMQNIAPKVGGGKLQMVVADGIRPPFKAGQFDATLSIHSHALSLNPEAALRAMRTTLKDNGRAIVVAPQITDPFGKGPKVDFRKFRKAAKNAGFRIIKTGPHIGEARLYVLAPNAKKIN